MSLAGACTSGGTARDNRLFVDAVLYRYRACIPWRDLPGCLGDWKNVHKRFSRWAQRGVWQTVLAHSTADADNEYAMIGSTIVRAHQHSAGAIKKEQHEVIGRSRGGLSTKTHATVDALGNPTAFYLTGRQASDLDGADVILLDLATLKLVADKGCDAQARVLSPMSQAGKEAVNPSKGNRTAPRPYDKLL